MDVLNMCVEKGLHPNHAICVCLQGLQFPLSYLQALRQLQLEEQLVVAQLQLPTQEDKLNLALALWSENLLRVL